MFLKNKEMRRKREGVGGRKEAALFSLFINNIIINLKTPRK